MSRVAILGASGSGKTTLACRLASALGVEHVELDALYHGPGWTHPSDADFRAQVEAIVARDAWVIDGGYGRMLDDIVPRAADTVVWIDLPLPQALARLARRSLRRWVLRTELWNGNRETLAGLIWEPDSLLRWTLKRHARFRRELPPLFASPAYQRKVIHRLRSQSAIDAFVASVSESPGGARCAPR